MTNLTILRGISGSGKSTWARQQNAIVVSRDAIRDMLFETHKRDPQAYYAQKKEMISACESSVSVVQDNTIAGLLRAGKDVIVDNTNIEWKFVKALAKIGYRYGAEVEVKVFDVDVDIAIERDLVRLRTGGRYVGADVINKQHARFKSNKSMQLEPVQYAKPYNGTPGKPKAFLVDIDGTLAHMTTRGPFDWKRVGEDDVDDVVADVVARVGNPDTWNEPLVPIVMSGRDAACRNETEAWLSKHGIYHEHLFMRPENDFRPDNIVKAELFDNYVRDNFDVQFVLDDRDQVVDMWRRMGLKVLQVEPGDF